ncbi:heparan-alpha-glucosaminide N-acetyltransferase domain-containing protein [Brachybacterium paraconglomeratum]|uniref:heparan-alpha-glucosaminide N-acetyltransferase domain-containing protein n=1 Tax=Brachybacterium paraconglomeratum TaxID=173362 RepID=UPI0022E65CF9|nr:heparan-alpha-glucosaminide N-acetyltransferase domain-containing protein [Brachybacterium paraconglomeratum]
MTLLLPPASAPAAPLKIGPRERLARLVNPPRLNGLDIARGLAILGMVAAHLGDFPPFAWSDPFSYLNIVHGNSAILFAVLAGISIALLTGRERIPEPEDLPRLRLALVGRGAAIFAIGLALELLGVGIAVILTFYGLLYVAAIPALRLRPSRLILCALPLALFGPVLVTLLEALSLGAYGAGSNLLMVGIYPLTTWAPLMMVGMALGRLPLNRPRIASLITAFGAGLAVTGTLLGLALSAALGVLLPEYQEHSSWDSTGYSSSWEASSNSSAGYEEEVPMVPFEEIEGTGLLCYPPMPYDPSVYCEPEDYGDAWVDEGSSSSSYWDEYGGDWSTYPERLSDMEPLPMLIDSVVSTAPHSGSVLEIFTSGGLALFVIGASTLLSRPLRWLLLPLSAIGAMPLTAYTLHALVILALTGPAGYLTSNPACLLLSVGLALCCTAWAAFFGRGPLERFTARSAHWLSSQPTPPQQTETSTVDADPHQQA